MLEMLKEQKEKMKFVFIGIDENFPLSENTRKILSEIGLPKQPFGFLELGKQDKDRIEMFSGEYLQIGHDFGTAICINPQDEIVSLDIEGEYPERFVNQNLESFLEYICILLKYETELLQMEEDEQEIEKLFQKIRQELYQADAKALKEEENW